MRKLAILLNIALLGFLCFLLIDAGGPHSQRDICLMFFLLATPAFNLFALWRPSGEGWLSLRMKRMAMEEQQKIAALRGESTRQD